VNDETRERHARAGEGEIVAARRVAARREIGLRLALSFRYAAIKRQIRRPLQIGTDTAVNCEVQFGIP